MPKKGSTKKEWEESRKKKRDEILKGLTKEELIEIIRDQDDIIGGNKEKIYKKILDKKLKCSKLNISKWCFLLKISTSYFYKLAKKSPSIDRRRRKDEPIIKELINKIYFDHNKTYGARRIHAILQVKYNISISYKTVYNYMKQLGLKAIIRKKNKRRIDLKNTRVGFENLLKRQFKNVAMNNVICTDVTYIKWKETYIYLSAAIDLRNNEIVGWSTSFRNDNNLVLKTFENIKLKEFRIIHSDHGYQYSSQIFTSMISKYNIKQSMSRLGNSLDNRPIEYWFSIIKEECLGLCDINKLTYKEIVELISNFIEYYNSSRIQLCLKNLPPVNYKKEILNI